MTIAIFARVLLALGVAGGCTLASRSLIHLFQLESYQFPGYRRSILRAWRRSVAPGLMMTVLSVALLAAHRTLDMHASEGVQLCLALAGSLRCFAWPWPVPAGPMRGACFHLFCHCGPRWRAWRPGPWKN